MAMSAEAQICSLLRQILKQYDAELEQKTINKLEELLGVYLKNKDVTG